MPTPIKLLDVVALTVDLPEDNLWRGQVGTVVEILANGSAFEVEFSDREGRTYESLGLRPEQIMVLHYEPLTAPPPQRQNQPGEVMGTRPRNTGDLDAPPHRRPVVVRKQLNSKPETVALSNDNSAGGRQSYKELRTTHSDTS